MTDNIANAINRVADAIFALSGAVTLLGWMFLLFKNMGGKERIIIDHDKVQK